MTSNTPETKIADGFTASALHSVLPMVIWAAHFSLSYASAEVVCALQLQRFTLAGVSALNIWLWSLSAVAIAALVGLTVVTARYSRADAKSGNMQATLRIGAAILALVGVLWSAVPIALLDGPTVCHVSR